MEVIVSLTKNFQLNSKNLKKAHFNVDNFDRTTGQTTTSWGLLILFNRWEDTVVLKQIDLLNVVVEEEVKERFSSTMSLMRSLSTRSLFSLFIPVWTPLYFDSLSLSISLSIFLSVFSSPLHFLFPLLCIYHSFSLSPFKSYLLCVKNSLYFYLTIFPLSILIGSRFKVKLWVRELRRALGDDCVLYIVGNKIDLAENRALPPETAKEWVGLPLDAASFCKWH